MKTIYVVLVTLLTGLTGLSQSPSIEWQKSLGGSSLELSFSIQQTSEGGYIAVGESFSNDGEVTGNHGGRDYWVVKLSSMGLIEWQKCLGGSNFDTAYSVKQTIDGGYIVLGTSKSNDGDVSGNHGLEDYWVVKLTPNGIIDWQKSLGGSNQDLGRSIEQTTDGGYIAVGSSTSNDGDVTVNNGELDCWVVKLSPQGSIEWQKSIGNSLGEYAWNIQKTSDGGYIISGTYFNQDESDFWIVKLDGSGDTEWQNYLGGSGYDHGRSVQQTLDGGYIVVGGTESNNGDVSGNHGDRDYWVVKLTNAGGIEWSKCLGGSGYDDGYAIRQVSDGGYIVAGMTNSIDGEVIGNHGSVDCWIIKLTSTGVIEWQKSLGGSGADGGRYIQQTWDGSYIVIAYSNSNDGDVTGNHGDFDYWVVKLSADLEIAQNELSKSVLLFPNPNTSHFSLSFSEEIEVTKVEVVDTLGKLIYSETNMPSENIEIDHNFPTGVYFVNVLTKDSEATLKMIVE